MTVLRRYIIHPFFFASFPVLALLAHNIQEVALEVVVRPLLVSLVGAVLIFMLLKRILRNDYRAGVITSYLLLLFFTYGHAYQAIRQIPTIGQVIGHHRYLLIAYALLMTLGPWWLGRKQYDLHSVNRILNIVSVGLLIYPVFQIVQQIRKDSEAERVTSILLSVEEPLEVPADGELPDIYTFILDTYTRQDAMLDFFNFDNSDFVFALEDLGFYVAQCSRCNYCFTIGAFTSSLNLNYLTPLQTRMAAQELDQDLGYLVKHSLVRGHLEAIGYKVIGFDSGYEWSRMRDAEFYLAFDRESIFDQLVTPFEGMLIRNSVGLVLADLQQQSARTRRRAIFAGLQDLNYFNEDYAKRQLFTLETIPQVVNIPGPKWVFAHILIPHPPRIFTPDGGIVEDPGYYSGESGGPINGEYEVKGYVNEVRFINARMLTILEDILRRSKTPPIIILQGDTGGPGSTLPRILNAYYLRGQESDLLYSSISPVNTYRLIFDLYFGTDYGLLPDMTFLEDDLTHPVPETALACTK
ncbi:MAG: hypothetical protein GTO14_01290 [Anaerolineales bacterium]|nr:hypothetical protein [Anaerolineales bacterium]